MLTSWVAGASDAQVTIDNREGGKTLTYFTFNKSHLGGKVKLDVDRIDSHDDSSSYALTNLTLEVS